MLEEVRHLKREVTDLRPWDTEKEKYQLTEITVFAAKERVALAATLRIPSARPEMRPYRRGPPRSELRARAMR
jgi:hypothetical protein